MKPKSTLLHFLTLASSSLLAISSASAADYTWGGGNLLWNNTTATGWNGGPPLATDTATINSGTVTFAINDTYGDAANTSSAAITVNSGGTLASGGKFNSLWNLTLGGGILLSNGGVAADFGTFNLAGTVTAVGGVTSSISTGTGSNNIINLGNGNTAAVTNTTFNVGAAGTLTVGTVLQNHRYWSGSSRTSTAGLIKTGDGQMNLNAINTYTGETNVNAGTLAINGTGSINTSSAIKVAAGGTLRYNSSTALNKVTLNGTGTGSGQRAVLGGTGPIGAAITLDNTGDVLSPGNSPGIQNYTVGQTWSSFSYDWEVNDFSDVTGLTAGSDFDQITGTGFNLTGGPNSYILNVLGLTASNVAGLTPSFSEIDRSWTILSSSGASTFNAANWTINTAGFSSPDVGTWSLAQAGNDLVLSYTAIPEPGAALIGSLGLLALLRRRR